MPRHRALSAATAIVLGLASPAVSAALPCSEGVWVADTCDWITSTGCCLDGWVRWCDDVQANGPLCGVDCASTGSVCTYDSDSDFFACRNAYVAPPEGVSEACCVRQCAGKACGDDDGCGSPCHGLDVPCPDGGVCEPDGTCCTPQCDGRECGPDGCGTNCAAPVTGARDPGGCGCGEACIEGSCVFVMCDDRACGPDGCSEDPEACGACPTGQVCGGDFTCCTKACAGRSCGPDGCGGSCGVCACGEACVDGTCVDGRCRQDGVTFECGTDACGTDCGACADSAARCVDHVCCVPDCAGKACGLDGCGGWCGVCDAGSWCLSGHCGPAVEVPGCAPREAPGCAGCACEACVAALDTYCQDSAWDTVCADECTNECGQACPCVPDCTNRDCGNDGCGGSCGDHGGTCPGEHEVCFGGTCCTPSCEGRACATDGCGGSCGACFGATPVCDNDGQCVADTCGPIGAVGCCLGTRLIACTANQVSSTDCASGDPGDVCGWYAGDSAYAAGYYCGPSFDEQGNVLVDPAGDPSGAHPPTCLVETPSCLGKPCGAPDGLGGVCGCPVGVGCTNGVCVIDPTSCYGKACGDDGMGGSCGTCPATAVCHQFQCCAPDCAGKECGDDGCGGTCGDCAGVCVDGTCEEDTPVCNGTTYEGCCDGATVRWCENAMVRQLDCATDPQAAGPLCGWAADAGYYWCGDTDAADPSGAFPHDCETPTCGCDGRQCGDDGCGGSCGTCPGLCGAPEPAPCVDGICSVACCRECEGRTCGDDGCGGSCGQCAAGQECHDGACACAPACVGRECGPDGCGGECGLCPKGTCSGEGQCVDAAADVSEGVEEPDTEVTDPGQPDTADPEPFDSGVEAGNTGGGSCGVGSPGGASAAVLLALLGAVLHAQRGSRLRRR